MGENVAQYANPEVDRLLDEGITHTDPESRRAIYAELQKILAEDRPIAWLQFPDFYFFQSTTLKGYWVPPFKTAPFGSYYEMWLQGE
jgi:ABC-type transport system substrate-binding protein